jgi:hypothetical protein
MNKNEVKFKATKDYPVGTKAYRRDSEIGFRKVRETANSSRIDGIEVNMQTVHVYQGKNGPATDRFVQASMYFVLTAAQVRELKKLIEKEVR